MNANCIYSPAELYEYFYGPGIFHPLAEVLLGHAPPPRGGRVIDLACGTGIVARHVSARVGRDGRVVAVDIDPDMLAIARNHPVPGGAPILYREGDIQSVKLPAASFDAAYCQQGLQFCSEPAAVLRRAHAALRPGGMMGVAVWRSMEEQTLLALFANVEMRYLGRLGLSYDDLAAPFSLGEADTLWSLLDDAGFSSIEMIPYTLMARFDDPPAVVRNMEAAYAAVVPAFTEDHGAFEEFVAAVEQDTKDIVAMYTVNNQVRFPMPANIAVARRR
jgi:ubiquinone/menaquinone biosynthesis C-methylase UbiE